HGRFPYSTRSCGISDPRISSASMRFRVGSRIHALLRRPGQPIPGKTKSPFRWEEVSRFSDLRPFAVAFPHSERKGKCQAFLQLMAEKLTNIFHRGVFQKIVPRSMIVLCQNPAQDLLQISKIDDHAAYNLAFDGEFDLIGVAVESSAFGM